MGQVRKTGLGAVAHIWGLVTPGPYSLLSLVDPGLNLLGTGLSQAHHFQGPASAWRMQRRGAWGKREKVRGGNADQRKREKGPGGKEVGTDEGR